jgi:TRAP-type mannitol/chloroaromatic compound transport system permease large subunit
MTSGIICAAGTLGILIPPSIMMVVYGGLTGLKETSVGNLFAGAIFPGLLLAGSVFHLYSDPLQHQPHAGPPDFQRRGRDIHGRPEVGHDPEIPDAAPGADPGRHGHHSGRRGHPHRGCRLGAAGAAILAFFNRKLNWPVFRDSCRATMKTTAMVMMLFIGGKFFSTVFLSMGGGDVVADVLIGSGLNRWIVLLIMMAIVFLMGMFIDWAAILLVTVPIFMPIAMELDFNPLWFSLLMCVNLQTSFLTPPFGYALFYFKGWHRRNTP